MISNLQQAAFVATAMPPGVRRWHSRNDECNLDVIAYGEISNTNCKAMLFPAKRNPELVTHVATNDAILTFVRTS